MAIKACNPKGSYDSNNPLTVNLGMSTPLLSRFDVILLLLDKPNKEWNMQAAMFLLKGNIDSNIKIYYAFIYLFKKRIFIKSQQ